MSTPDLSQNDWELEDISTNSNESMDKRAVEGGLVSRTGHTHTNSKGAGEWQKVCEASKVNHDKAAMKYKVNKVKKLIYGYAFEPGSNQAKGIAEVRHHKNRTISFHLGGVFKEAEILRPAGKVRVKFSAEVDPQGKPCLVINMALAVQHVARSRKK